MGGRIDGWMDEYMVVSRKYSMAVFSVLLYMTGYTMTDYYDTRDYD